MRQATSIFALFLLLFAHRAAAFTPETGLWWNPLEDGRGYSIEIQDNVLVMIVYGYDTDGTSGFFTAANAMTGINVFSASLDGYAGGQCNTCAYSGRPVILSGAGGTLLLGFTSETTAVIHLNGRAIPIQRLNFAHGNLAEKMLGEWQVTLDLSPIVAASAHPFFGDVIKLDQISPTDPNTYLGCRPANSDYARCTSVDFATHYAAGSFVTSTNSHAMVVKDGVGSAGQNIFLLYNLEVGLSKFDGQARFSESGAMSPLLGVRGFRSAGRRFVQGGAGPSSVEPKRVARATGILEQSRENLAAEAFRGSDADADVVHPDVQAEWQRLIDVLD